MAKGSWITISALFLGLIFLIPPGIIVGEDILQIKDEIDASFYSRLIDRLSKEGFERSRLEAIFSDPRVIFFDEVLDRNLVFRESKANYTQFTTPESIALARAFLEQYRSYLEGLERGYGVHKEVIVAILLVESYFGKWPGRYGLVSVFSTLSMLSWPDVAGACKVWLKSRYPEIPDDYIERRIDAKAKWAFKELTHLLRIEEKGGLDILDLKGSWAGAYGLCQFLPSSLSNYGVDGDGDGMIRLDEPHDAMASIANYLRKNGWRPGISKKEKEKVLLKYNQSNLYVEAVLQVAHGLKRGKPQSNDRSVVVTDIKRKKIYSGGVKWR